jgi:DNA modification methylase
MIWRVGSWGKVILGDSLEVLRKLPSSSIDALCTDPPGGASFMGRAWDGNKGGRDQWVAWLSEVMREAHRVLKPGAYGLVWAFPRTSHWTAWALEDAGFFVQECIYHIHGQGFPKNRNVAIDVDRKVGAEPVAVGERPWTNQDIRGNAFASNPDRERLQSKVLEPTSEEGQQWLGWGNATKPAVECWWLVQKPFKGSIADNLLKWGVGALNVGACEVRRTSDDVPGWHKTGSYGRTNGYLGEDTFKIRDMPPEEVQARRGKKGRHAPNLLLTHSEHCVLVGTQKVKGCPTTVTQGGKKNPFYNQDDKEHEDWHDTFEGYGDAEGLEVVDLWACVPGCPVRKLDEDGCKASKLLKSPSRFFPNFQDARKCFLCHQPTSCDPVNGAVTSLLQRNQAGVSVQTRAQRHQPAEVEVRNQSESISVASAGSDSGNMNPTSESSVLLSAPASLPEQIAHHVWSVASLCERCGTTIAQAIAEKKPDLCRGLIPGQDSICALKEQILIQSLAPIAEDLESIGIIPTIQKLRRWCGSVQLAIAAATRGNDGDGEIDPILWKYQAKASRSEKEAGLDELDHAILNRVNPGGLEAEPRWAPVKVKNNHPTVKSIALCRWLCKLITPPGGLLIDPFCGSGSIGCAAVLEGFRFLGIEQGEPPGDPRYCEIAVARMEHWKRQAEERTRE